MRPPSVSAIIPAWNEARTIAAAVGAARGIADEVIVVDAGSPDGTAEIAASSGAVIVRAARGRGPQLHAGGQRARGDVLLFLHADARLAQGARAAIGDALSDDGVVGGNFLLEFEPRTFAARVFSAANDLRRRWFRIYYGDSAIFVRRSVYASLGGFRAMPIFEDYDFVRRLERFGRTKYVREVVVVASARRFEKAPMWTLLVWTMLQILFSLGVPAQRLARFYGAIR